MEIDRDQLQKALEESLARRRVPGASVGVFHDGALTAAAAGITNLATGIPVTADTVMHIGSITKVFNTTLVMQLVDEGRIALDAPVLRYLPDLKLKDRAALEKITMKMLLNHTSGINGELLPEQGHDEETIEKGVRRFAELDQLFQPGAEFSYCNVAMTIAGHAAERVAGKSWYRLVRERIFEPLGMARSAALPEDALLHRWSVGHYLQPDGSLARTTFAFLPMSFGPAGATLMMSASDLVAFARAHMASGMGANGTRILSEESAKAMQQTTVSFRARGYANGGGIGLGWVLPDEGLLNHGGGGPGILASLYVHPQSGFAAAVLTNAAHGTTVINDIMEPWLSELGVKSFGKVAVSKPPQTLAVDLDNYAGVYEDLISRFDIVKTPDGLTVTHRAKFSIYDNMTTDPMPPVLLRPVGNDRLLLLREGAGDEGMIESSRILTFRNPDSKGRMQMMGPGMRLYKRTA